MDPELVAGQEIGDIGNGEGLSGARDADVDLGPNEVEARVGETWFAAAEKKGGQQQQSGALIHTDSLDARPRLR
jgi:hypothetical protein